MSELIERLRRFAESAGHYGDHPKAGAMIQAADALEAKDAEITRLRPLVKEAYFQGCYACADSGDSMEVRWNASEAKNALEGKVLPTP